jgi:tryptophan synthase alpha chain
MEIKHKFEELAQRREGAFMAHIYYGDPNPQFSNELAKTLARSGADFLEIGIPFTDPTADGPTFTSACERALKAGTTPKSCIEGIKRLRSEGVDVPIIVTTYYNIPFSWGIEKFFDALKEAKANGVIIPDLPYEEAGHFIACGRKKNVDVILQVSPTTNEERLRKIVDASSGFIYLISVEGVTGARESLHETTLGMIQRVKNITDLPLMVGFGISTKDQAAQIVSTGADGVVVGSAIAKIYEKNLSNPFEVLDEISDFATEIKKGCVEGFARRGLSLTSFLKV